MLDFFGKPATFAGVVVIIQGIGAIVGGVTACVIFAIMAAFTGAAVVYLLVFLRGELLRPEPPGMAPLVAVDETSQKPPRVSSVT